MKFLPLSSTVLLFCLGACGTYSPDPDSVNSGEPAGGKADSPNSANLETVRTGISSANARATARYLSTRDLAALRAAGALPPLLDGIVRRIGNYGKPFGIDGLLYAEDPARYATFLPDERAAFPSLWKLLEIDDAIDLDAAGRFAPLSDLIVRREPQASKMDENRRVDIVALPLSLQTVAQRVKKTASAAIGTISFQEVVDALANYQDYVANEYFTFGPLLREIEALLVDPATFPALEQKGDPTQSETFDLAPQATLTIARTATSACQHRYSSTAVSSTVTISFTIPAGTTVTWTKLNSAGGLYLRNTYWNSLTEYFAVTASMSYVLSTGDHALALVEAWQAGARVAQILIVPPTDESVSADGFAIVKNGSFVCLPYANEWASDSLPDVMRLAGGRYSVSAGSYGTATLNVYGSGLMRLDVGTKTFWASDGPSPTSPNPDYCWELTSLGPHNMVTDLSGAGPGFRFVYDSNKVFFDEQSYGICFGGGTATALSVAGRL